MTDTAFCTRRIVSTFGVCKQPYSFPSLLCVSSVFGSPTQWKEECITLLVVLCLVLLLFTWRRSPFWVILSVWTLWICGFVHLSHIWVYVLGIHSSVEPSVYHHRSFAFFEMTEVRYWEEATKVFFNWVTYREFPTRMVYLYYISCLRYTILVVNLRCQIMQSEYIFENGCIFWRIILYFSQFDTDKV